MAEPPHRPDSSQHLVAPELKPALDLIPQLEFNDELLRAAREGIVAGSGQQPVLSPAQEAVSCTQRFVPGPPGAPDVRVLVYTAPDESDTPRPAFLHIHGGGFVLGQPEINDAANRSLAAGLGCTVVSVDYRLAPETRYPGAVEDCYAALLWLYRQAAELGIDSNRIAIGGESAGGGHAAALAIVARERCEVPICLQLLDSPMLDDRTGSASDPHPYCGEFIWTPANNRFGWRALLGIEPGGVDVPPGAAPARVADLSGLPPTLIVVGALDLFLEESLEYARRLTRAGVPTELHVIPGAFHAFQAAGSEAPQVRECLRWCQGALKRAWDLADNG